MFRFGVCCLEQEKRGFPGKEELGAKTGKKE